MPIRACAKPIWGPMSSLLRVEGLSVRYGRVHAVRAANMAVADGEVVAVLGANGAGKSSLLRALMGLVRSEGRITLGAKDITRASPGERIAAGMVLVPEGRRIVMSLTVDENLQMGA